MERVYGKTGRIRTRNISPSKEEKKKMKLLNYTLSAVINIVPFGKADFYETSYWKLGAKN